MSAVQIGRIIPSGKVHLETYRGGIADNHLRNITHHAENLAQVETARLCKRCFTPARIRAAISVAHNYRGTSALLAFLGRALDAVKPAEVLAELDALAAGMADFLAATDVDANYTAAMAATVSLAPAVQPLPEAPRRRTWADLRREFAEGMAKQAAAPIAA